MTAGSGSNGHTVAPVASPSKVRELVTMNSNKILGTILAMSAFVVYVILSLYDDNAANLQNFTLFAIPFVTALLIKDKLDGIKDTANDIQHQTNGVLTQKIKAAVNDVMSERAATETIESENYNG